MGVERLNHMASRQIDKKSTKQVRIDAGLHQLLKVYAAESKLTIKELLEDCLSDLLAVDKPRIYKTRVKTVVSLEKRNENITQPEQNHLKKPDQKRSKNIAQTDQNQPAVKDQAIEPENQSETIAQLEQKTYNLTEQ